MHIISFSFSWNEFYGSDSCQKFDKSEISDYNCYFIDSSYFEFLANSIVYITKKSLNAKFLIEKSIFSSIKTSDFSPIWSNFSGDFIQNRLFVENVSTTSEVGKGSMPAGHFCYVESDNIEITKNFIYETSISSCGDPNPLFVSQVSLNEGNVQSNCCNISDCSSKIKGFLSIAPTSKDSFVKFSNIHNNSNSDISSTTNSNGILILNFNNISEINFSYCTITQNVASNVVCLRYLINGYFTHCIFENNETN